MGAWNAHCVCTEAPWLDPVGGLCRPMWPAVPTATVGWESRSVLGFPVDGREGMCRVLRCAQARGYGA